ncbi:hypothetical protein DFP72DRAFT_879128 [Ephemerocybe angulata]|uniref:F-box domain-containing protein n=1 Tax=Ephemerocybe angulata TaxID=980116 RepID=A0A8H6MF17_9AGAR|nr:hypothetical protein DFP72DRAFT_879128 [Tulosesus angulatus]
MESLEKPNDDSAELARFRAEWRAEVDRRRQQLEGDSSASQPKDSTPDVKPAAQRLLFKKPATRATAGAQASGTGPSTGAATGAGPSTSHPAIKHGAIAATAATSPALSSALAIYKKAVHFEQSGDLDNALAAYRQAFRLDPNVDRAFHLEEMLRAKLQSYSEKVPDIGASPASPELLATKFQQLTLQPDTPSPTTRQASRLLIHIIEAFPEDVKFEPEDERHPVYLNRLPTEILYVVLRKLDVPNFERFARVCRRARLLTLDPAYWSELVRSIHKPPQLPSADDLLGLVQTYESNFRQLYIAQPRVRTDGLYIAICHYTRPGLSENSWVNVNHLITYHRYLRFYPNGQVLSLLANEEYSPKAVIPILKPTLRMKGFYIGNWYLTGTTLSVVNLMDASGKYVVPLHDATTLTSDWSSLGFDRPSPAPSGTATPTTNPAPSSSTNHPTAHPTSARGGRGGHSHQGHSGQSNAAAPEQIRYVFDMSLQLKSKPLGRWNKLDMETYDSVNLETGEVHPFPLKHERPFWFSKVRSFA